MKGVEILIKLNDQMTKGMKSVNKTLEDTAYKLQKIEEETKSLEKLRQGALIAGGAIAVGLGLATAKAIQFESALSPVKTVLSGTAEEVEQASKRIGKNALSWTSQYAHSTEEYLGASYNLLSAGLNETQAIAGTEQALKLATATLGDATTSSALLGTLYNNFGNKVNDANTEMIKLSDTVAKTQQLFQIANLSQLNEGLSEATSSALSFKIGFSQTSAVIGQLNTLGITGSKAGTTFGAITRTLTKGSKELGYTIARTADGGIDLVKTLRNISAVGASADTIQKVFGDEGARGINLLTAKIGDLESNLVKVGNSAGATETAFQRMQNTQAKITIFFNNLKNISIAVGNTFMWMIGGMLSVINPVLQVFSNLITQNQWFASAVGIVGVAISGVLLAFGSYVFWIKSATMVTGIWTSATTVATSMTGAFAGSISALTAALLANPFSLVIIKVFALISAVFLLVKHWDKVVLAVKTVWNFMLNFIPNTINLLKKVRDTIAISLIQAWDSVVLAWNNGIKKLISWWESFKIKTLEIWNSVAAYIQTVWNNIQAIFTIEWWVNLGNQIMSIFDQVFSFEFWKEQFVNMLNSILGSVGNWWENIKKIARGQKVVEDDPIEKVVDQDRKVTIDTEYTNPKNLPNTLALNKDTVIPIEHTNFLAKNGIGEGNIAPAGQIKKTSSINQQHLRQTQKGNTTNIVIDKIEIADGVISNLDDFVLQLHQRAMA